MLYSSADAGKTMVHEPSFQLWRDSWFTEVSEKQHAEARV